MPQKGTKGTKSTKDLGPYFVSYVLLVPFVAPIW